MENCRVSTSKCINLFIPDHPQLIPKSVVLHAKEKDKEETTTIKQIQAGVKVRIRGSALGNLRREYQELEAASASQ